jgi:aerobic carbon-monoxide dehydrogenase small subunit
VRNITLTINGHSVTALVEPRTHLADFLREHLSLTGTHLGCEHGVCGACTVAVNGEIARSCITYAVQCDGAEITTIEGFDDDALMTRLRAAFTANHALQCGYCTPGMLIAARDLVRRFEHADEQLIREEMSDNLCRCTGYMGIVAAVQQVMGERAELSALPPSRATLGPAPGPAALITDQDLRLLATGRPRATETRRVVSSADVEEISEEGLVTLQQSFVVNHPAAEVWNFFGNLPQVARCMPGAAITSVTGDRLEGEVRVKLGPITAAFAGQGRITRDETARRATIVGQGRDTRSGSRARGRVVYVVQEGEQGRARVDVEVGYALAGPLAHFGRGGIVIDLANRLTQAFAENLEIRLVGGDTQTVDIGTPAPLNAGGLVWSVLWDRLKAALRRLRGGH